MGRSCLVRWQGLDGLLRLIHPDVKRHRRWRLSRGRSCGDFLPVLGKLFGLGLWHQQCPRTGSELGSGPGLFRCMPAKQKEQLVHPIAVVRSLRLTKKIIKAVSAKKSAVTGYDFVQPLKTGTAPPCPEASSET